MEQNESHALILIDEDDNEIEFDMLDKFDFEGSTFLVLLPVDDDSDELEYVILRDAGEGALAGIDDEDQLDRVFAEYKKRNDIED
ncbi:MAG: DUF1292 domain-containing protein [Clostridia bacterium]|nr:DUF1292 domain-containing protein [Clostridia bacterium]MBQ3938052.1 DUF1292 domain-containing protein [Clostridia bacterium]MBQ5487433.1 DUF1292 domain-containing protein [Clostridia bacterium]